jgi:FdhD protein
VIKSAQMGIAVVVSRSGTTQMGLEVAGRVGLCAIGRALHQRFLCYSHPQRLIRDVDPGAGMPVALGPDAALRP